jgi:hypothetical protein
MPTGAYSTIIPPVCLNANFTMGNHASIIPSLNVAIENTLSRAPSVNEAFGYARVDITDRKVTGSFAPEAELIASKDWYTIWSGGTKNDFSIQLGATAGNIIKFTAPQVVFTGFSHDDRGGVLVHTMPFRCAELATVISGAADAATGALNIKDATYFTTNDLYNGARLTFNTGTYANKARIISDTIAASTTVTLETALGGAPGVADVFTISKKELQILFR